MVGLPLNSNSAEVPFEILSSFGVRGGHDRLRARCLRRRRVDDTANAIDGCNVATRVSIVGTVDTDGTDGTAISTSVQ